MLRLALREQSRQYQIVALPGQGAPKCGKRSTPPWWQRFTAPTPTSGRKRILSLATQTRCVISWFTHVIDLESSPWQKKGGKYMFFIAEGSQALEQRHQWHRTNNCLDAPLDEPPASAYVYNIYIYIYMF